LATLLAVHGIPIPKILAFDATSVNAIHSPYTFQEVAEGTRLDEVYDKISLEEKAERSRRICQLTKSDSRPSNFENPAGVGGVALLMES